MKKIFFIALVISLWLSGEVLSQTQTYDPFHPPFGLPAIAPIPPINTNTRSDSGQDPLELRVPLQPSGESLLGIGSRRSNIDLNKPTERRTEATEEEVTEEEAPVTPEEEITEASEEEAAEPAPSTLEKRRIYRWVDKNGISHFTDNLGSIPSEYVDKMFGNRR